MLCHFSLVAASHLYQTQWHGCLCSMHVHRPAETAIQVQKDRLHPFVVKLQRALVIRSFLPFVDSQVFHPLVQRLCQSFL